MIVIVSKIPNVSTGSPVSAQFTVKLQSVDPS